MALWNPNDLIPGPVRDIAGILGLAALGTAMTIVVASRLVARRQADDDNPTSGTLAMAWLSAKLLVVLGSMLLLTWSLPWLLNSGHYDPVPPPIRPADWG